MCPVDALEVDGAGVERGEEGHDVPRDSCPRSFVETWPDAIGTERAVHLHGADSQLGLSLAEGSRQGVLICFGLVDVELPQVEAQAVASWRPRMEA